LFHCWPSRLWLWLSFGTLGHIERMEILEHILIWLAIFLGIGWSAVFICALASKQRGTMPRFFSGGSRHFTSRRPLAWWQHLIRLPLYIIFLLVFGLCCLILLPPMFVVERLIYRT
jgi:hypothetical protein